MNHKNMPAELRTRVELVEGFGFECSTLRELPENASLEQIIEATATDADNAQRHFSEAEHFASDLEDYCENHRKYS